MKIKLALTTIFASALFTGCGPSQEELDWKAKRTANFNAGAYQAFQKIGFDTVRTISDLDPMEKNLKKTFELHNKCQPADTKFSGVYFEDYSGFPVLKLKDQGTRNVVLLTDSLKGQK